jgi:putative peptide zinc metalloprotease protein
MSEATDVEIAESTDENAVPQLVDGVTLCGEYEGGGYQEPRYLISRADGQMVLVSRLLYGVASELDGERDLREVAERVSRSLDMDVSAVGVEYLVNEKLYPMGIATMTEPLPDPPRAEPLLSLVCHGQLLPGPVVRAIAPLFAPFYKPFAIVVMLCAFVGVDIWLVATGHIDAAIHRSVGDPVLVLSLMALWVFSTLFHEFGHAAGCHYGGARPGAIGVGILIFYPCFYTNVTDAYRLDRRGRLRTDLGGIYFNAIFIVAMAGVYEMTAFPPLLVFMVLNHLQILQQLLPLLRLDGYYIMADLVGVPNMFTFVGPVLRRLRGKRAPSAHHKLNPRTQLIVTVWVLVVVPVLILSLIALLIRLPFYLATGTSKAMQYGHAALHAASQGHVGALLLASFSVVVLLLPWVGGTAFFIRTGKRAYRLVAKVAARRRRRKPRPRHRKQSGRWRSSQAA